MGKGFRHVESWYARRGKHATHPTPGTDEESAEVYGEVPCCYQKVRLVLRGQVLVDLDETGEPDPKPRIKTARKKKVPIERLCGYTKESIRPATFESFINQCVKESGHAPPHMFETK